MKNRKTLIICIVVLAFLIGGYFVFLKLNTSNLSSEDSSASSAINLLENGSFPKNSFQGWTRWYVDNVTLSWSTVLKNNNRALVLNCGNLTCKSGVSIFQDVYIKDLNIKSLDFGLDVASDKPNANINVVLWEFDSKDKMVANSTINIKDQTTNYRSFKKTVTVNSQTTKIRYEVYLVGDGGNRYIDNIKLTYMPSSSSKPTFRTNQYLKNSNFESKNSKYWNLWADSASNHLSLNIQNSNVIKDKASLLLTCKSNLRKDKLCNTSSSIYQDVNITSKIATKVAFGGYFKAVDKDNIWGQSKLKIVLWQFDSKNNLVASSTITEFIAGVSPVYKTSNALINSKTQRVRLEIYVTNNSNRDVMADNLFLTKVK